MTKIYQAVDQIDTDARDLVRKLATVMPAEAILALRIVDRIGDIKWALGAPPEQPSDTGAAA